MKNKLTDLNNHLFAQIERLSDEDLTAEQIEAEAKRAQAIVRVSDQIVKGASLQLKAVEIVAAHGDRFLHQLPMIEDKTA
ncbi:hypothetical protein DFR49_2314 [Hephaestia caeni]|uniref:Phage protein n=1 Tax=Hephaestia caeni TaxID=645617 RepID=A0A397PA74_9SPHN|nr:hypothetical protein [Hephaestia caeni]RIA44077.1 hypothetical protein DFR49_2314 [Hephaestia caeni]